MDTLRFFTGMFRSLRTFILRREVEIVGQCHMCGKCCQDIVIQDQGNWLTSKRKFKKICEQEPEYERFRILGRDGKGHLLFGCKLQNEDGTCSCHEDRLSLCRNYPSKSIYYQGAWIEPECGYRFKSIKFRDVFTRKKPLRAPRFSKVLDQEIEQAEKKR
ncbi:YkgJ family cysteine cluster protein [Pseudodesulfovibrio sp. zrk46]|uniref:YkgJ family cysteine cluster protein n=1 Tax=Pseudodesulfovibrio sp. zrk46 TaxID=2725288 RepID=UPI001448D7CF|nr:YkgJ family cysteine cluster protein [Pseudodesulfovibrio sp. zrk46]QJB55831.1 YkgJ family cysteine cluster protein [Pseudodesulfovibrio sp. zrk46]